MKNLRRHKKHLERQSVCGPGAVNRIFEFRNHYMETKLFIVLNYNSSTRTYTILEDTGLITKISSVATSSCVTHE